MRSGIVKLARWGEHRRDDLPHDLNPIEPMAYARYRRLICHSKYGCPS
jgi:hypothetical protein